LIRHSKVQAFWGSNGYLPPYKISGVATVVTVHDLAEVFAPQTQARLVSLGRRVLQPRAVRVANRVIAVSWATAADIESTYGRHVHEVIHPLVSGRFRIPETDSPAIREKYKLPERYLLTVGTLEPTAGLINVPALARAKMSLNSEAEPHSLRALCRSFIRPVKRMTP
jgi:hypothetical protein